MICQYKGKSCFLSFIISVLLNIEHAGAHTRSCLTCVANSCLNQELFKGPFGSCRVLYAGIVHGLLHRERTKLIRRRHIKVFLQVASAIACSTTKKHIPIYECLHVEAFICY